MQFQGKLKSQISENGEKPNSGLQFGSFATKFWFSKFLTWLLPTLDVRHCCNLYLYAISRKTNNSNSRKWRKTSFWTWFRPLRPRFRLPNIFSKIGLPQSLDIMVNYHHVQYQKKQIIQSREKLVWTDRQTDGCKWFHRTLSDYHRASNINTAITFHNY